MIRVGTGFDAHRFTARRPLVLGGVEIPHSAGLEGHSDADVLCHAIIDALLGAASCGDIGSHFPDTDDRWKDACSLDMLGLVVKILAERGYAVGNVDATVIAERPKIAPHVEAMRSAMARVMGVDIGCISVKGKTVEGMGALGRGEGIAVMAIATVVSGRDREQVIHGDARKIHHA
jgi:2-C-methyl-D-erythritol 2,4-cyclodiphosphate synthase